MKNVKPWIWGVIWLGVVLIGVGIWFLSQDAGDRMSTSTPTQIAFPTLTPIPTPTRTPTPAPLTFDPEVAYQRVLEQCGFGPRPPGSINNRQLGDYLLSTVQSFGWQTLVHEFVYQDVPCRNITAQKGTGPLVILGAHYDTRPYADYDPPQTRDQYILGANDGGSGVAVLLELARVLNMDVVPYEVWLVFFDAEDSGRLDGWPFSVGAREYVQTLQVEPALVIVVDMVGDQEQTLYWEGNSHPQLRELVWTVADELGYGQFFIPQVQWHIIDDHLPFVEKGWKAIDIIDFDYPYWHTTQDTADRVSAESLGRVGRVLEVCIEQGRFIETE